MNEHASSPALHTEKNQTRALTKAELADHLCDRIGLNKREAKELVDTFFETVRETLARGEQVKLSGFGSFQVRSKAPRPGRNPKTGEIIPIAARRVVTFHASQKLKNAVAQTGGRNHAAGRAP